ncbi:MAG: hypothetical protein ABIJ92_03170 [Candidatus Aenigmatarchaeota archaeon]
MALLDPTVILPFFFMFALVYGALEASSVFSNNAVKSIIALVIAFFTISSQPALDFINQAFPYAIPFFIVAFFLSFVIKMFKGKEGEKDYTLIAIVIGLILLLLASQGSVLTAITNIHSDLVTGIGLALIALIFFAGYQQAKGGGSK